MSRELPMAPIVAQAEESLEQLAAAANACHEAGESATRRGLEHFRAAGEALLKAKKRCRHGKWLPWLAKNVRFDRRTATNYMRVAANWETVSQMDGMRDALRLLTADAEDEQEQDQLPLARDERLIDDWCDLTEELEESSSETDTTTPPVATQPVLRLGQPGEVVTLSGWRSMSAAERAAALSPGLSSKKFNDQGDNENIEWALWSWNPVTGCEHNCPYCYARDIAERFYEPRFEPALWPSRLLAPRNTPFPEAKAAEWMGHKNVFTCSMADLFGRWVPREWIDAVLDAVRAAPQWNFLFLTKFPVRMAEFDFPDNAWVGTSVDCQARVANAERSFRKVKAKVKWLSCEPLIEPLTFTDLGAFDWVVIGGASRSVKTPEWVPPDEWVTSLKAEAYRAGVKVYEKSNIRNDRTRQYPGIDAASATAPEALQYLAKVEARP